MPSNNKWMCGWCDDNAGAYVGLPLGQLWVGWAGWWLAKGQSLRDRRRNKFTATRYSLVMIIVPAILLRDTRRAGEAEEEGEGQVPLTT